MTMTKDQNLYIFCFSLNAVLRWHEGFVLFFFTQGLLTSFANLSIGSSTLVFLHFFCFVGTLVPSLSSDLA